MSLPFVTPLVMNTSAIFGRRRGNLPPFRKSQVSVLIEEVFFKFGSTLIANPDGTRLIKNEGSAPDSDADLFSGQGLQATGDQSIDTGAMVDITKGWTWLRTCNVPADDLFHREGVYQSNKRLYFGVEKDKLICGVGDLFLNTINHGQAIGNTVHTAVTGDGSRFSVYLNGGQIGNNYYSYGGGSPTIPFYLLARNNNGSSIDAHLVTMSKDAMLIPQQLTEEQIQAHYQNPERTFYWEGGVAKSDILDQATIDSMLAGNGFVYLLNEGVDASTSSRDQFFAINLATPLGVSNADVTHLSSITNGDGNTAVDNDLDETTFTLVGATTTNNRPSVIIEGMDVNNYYKVTAIIEATEDIALKAVRGATSEYSCNLNVKGRHVVTFIDKPISANDGFMFGFNGLDDANGTVPVFPNTVTVKTTVEEVDVKAIQGMIDATPRTNAQSLPYGTQNALLTDDLRGLLPSGQFRFDGTSNMQLPPVTLPSDYCIDLVLHRGEYNGSNQFVLQDSDNKIYIYMNSTNRRLYYRFSNQYPYADGGNNIGVGERIVITLEVVGSELKLYHNGEFMATYSITPITGFDTIFLGSRNNGADKLRGVVADFSILPEARTDEERTAAVGALMTKHGVT